MEDCQKIEEQIKGINTKLKECDNDFKAKYGSYVTFTDSVDLADNYFATFIYLQTEIPVIFKNNERSTEQTNAYIACCKEGLFQNNNYEEKFYESEMEEFEQWIEQLKKLNLAGKDLQEEVASLADNKAEVLEKKFSDSHFVGESLSTLMDFVAQRQ